MISVIVTILKIIGIVLLCILGLLVFLFLSVLFVPIRYSFQGEYKEDLYVKAKITWFLHILSLSFIYKEKEPVMKLRLLGIPLSFLEKTNKKTNTPPKKNKVKQEVKQEEKVSTNIPVHSKEEPVTQEESFTQKEEPIFKKTNKKKPPAFFDKIKKTIRAIMNFISSFINKTRNIKDNFSYYMELLSHEDTIAAYKTCKYRFGKLIHHVIPKRFEVHVTYGLDDPASTAKILAIHSMFYAYIGNYIYLHPDFEEQTLEINTKGNGRITSGIFGYHILKVFFDRNCRNFLSKLKKESLDE